MVEVDLMADILFIVFSCSPRFLFLSDINRTLLAYWRVLSEQDTQSSVGETVAIRMVRQWPMKQSRRTRVSLLCLNGACKQYWSMQRMHSLS